MKLIRILWRESPAAFLIAVAFGMLNSATSLYLLSVIARSAVSPGNGAARWPMLLGLLLVLATSAIAAPIVALGVTHRLVLRVRGELARATLSAQLVSIEAVKPSVIFASLAQDTERLTTALPSSVNIARDVVFIAACVVYLASIAPAKAVATLAFIAAIVLINHWLRVRAADQIGLLLRRWEHLIDIFRDMRDGAKELKLRPDLRQQVEAHTAKLDAEATAGLRLATAYSAAADWITTALLFGALLLAGGVLLADETPVGTRAAFMIVGIMMLTPLRSLPVALQALREGSAALDRMVGLSERLGGAASLGAPGVPQGAPVSSVQCVRLRDVEYRYGKGAAAEFTTGRISIELVRGDILFVTGGNGSGKTTFLKVLTGLYVPSVGDIFVDGVVVNAQSRSSYMQLFSAVFYDFCLFEGLVGTAYDRPAQAARELLSRLGLAESVTPDRGLLAQAKHLSSGQRRRVALLLSLMNDRPIFVFDEFAADQDAGSKKFFYEVLLPELQMRRKIIVAVTHDAAYQHCCSATLALERGRTPVFRRIGNSGLSIPRPSGVDRSM